MSNSILTTFINTSFNNTSRLSCNWEVDFSSFFIKNTFYNAQIFFLFSSFRCLFFIVLFKSLFQCFAYVRALTFGESDYKCA